MCVATHHHRHHHTKLHHTTLQPSISTHKHTHKHKHKHTKTMHHAIIINDLPANPHNFAIRELPFLFLACTWCTVFFLYVIVYIYICICIYTYCCCFRYLNGVCPIRDGHCGHHQDPTQQEKLCGH